MFPTRRVVGSLIVVALFLGTIPANKAEVLLPTIETCDEVEVNLLNWDTLTWDQMNWTAEMGAACEEKYPLLYDPAPTSTGDDDEGATCDTFGSLNNYDTACSWAYARVNAYTQSSCDGSRLSGQYCYFKEEYGTGWSDLRQTSGKVTTSGMKVLSAYWTHMDDPQANTPEVENYHWHLPGETCLQVDTVTVVRVLNGGGLEVPGSGVLDEDDEVC